MWKRHSHRNQKIWPGYVPEMPFGFYWTSTVTSDPALHERRDASFHTCMTLDSIFLWIGCAVEYTVTICTTGGRVMSTFRGLDRTCGGNKGLLSPTNQ